MLGATLAILCVCITIAPGAVHGWDVYGHVELRRLDLRRLLVNYTLVTKIPTDFLQGVRFAFGSSSVVTKVVPQDWKRLENGLYSVHINRTILVSYGVRVHHFEVISPGYNSTFCWVPWYPIIGTSNKAVKIGEPHTLSCQLHSNGTAPRTYKWYKSPGPTDYIHIGRQLTLPAANIHEGGAYSCGAQNECGKTKKSSVTKIYVEVPFLVEEKTSPTAVTKDDLSFNITISGNHLHSPSIHMLADTEEPSVQSRDIEGNFHYGQRKAKLFTMRWNVLDMDGNWTCYDTSKRVNGEYILRVMFQETEKKVVFKVDMKCGSKKTLQTGGNKPSAKAPSALGTGIGIGAGMILVVVLVVVAGYFIKKRMTQAQVDEINLVPN